MQRYTPGSPARDWTDLSVVIPCLNELGTIARCVGAALEGIEAAGLSGEVIIADNGSTDGSVEAAEAVGARVVHESRRGYGMALLAGFLAARGRLLVMGDGDLSYDFRELPRLVEEQRRTRADIVLGDRLHGRIEPGAMPWRHRWIDHPLISFTLRRLFGVPLNDCYCGLRLLTRESFQRLQPNANTMEYALEMIVQGALVGMRFAQVPITLHVARPTGSVARPLISRAAVVDFDRHWNSLRRPHDTVEVWTLACLARLLPANQRQRFVTEAQGNLGDCEHWWQRVDQLIWLTLGMPRLTWMMRRDGRRGRV